MGGDNMVFCVSFNVVQTMKIRLFPILFLFFSFGALGEQTPPAASPVSSAQARSSMVSRPSLESVQRVFEASGMKVSNPVLVLGYDDAGVPVEVMLDPLSGNELLDQAILEWGRQVRFAPGKAGIKRLPFDLIGGGTEKTENPPDIHSPEIAAADLVRVPPMHPIGQVMSSQKIYFASVQLLIEYDANGKVSSARLEQSTGNNALDSAFINWARRLKIKSGAAGKGRFPVEIQGKPAKAADAASNRF